MSSSTWDFIIRQFKSYLITERSLSANSVEAYLHDVALLSSFLQNRIIVPAPEQVTTADIEELLATLYDLGMSAASQARILSGLRSFFEYLKLERMIESVPTELIEGPKLGRKLPDVLTFKEINMMIESLDLSKEENVRNKAMLLTLYSCGLRVSELINLKISGIYKDAEVIKVIGKGDKERIVPIGRDALKHIEIYAELVRKKWLKNAQFEDDLFLGRYGRPLTRVMVFLVIKQTAALVGIQKKVSPHTFRHSFATHMIENGADLRAVQMMLGHSSITTTEIYTHLDQQYLRDAMSKFHPRFKDSI
jgi:integrase/recombinase XerD